MEKTLYHHYKNKSYLFRGIARHSETLEELAVYECLYENPTSLLWVRPRNMFFDSIEINGTSIPRFAKQEIAHSILVGTKNILEAFPRISQIFSEFFPTISQQALAEKLASRKNALLILATLENTVVGFKLGFEIDDQAYYSWLGGVSAKFQGLKVGENLMNLQEQWCRSHSYNKIKTKTLNRWKNMLILNLKMGFSIVETYQDGNHELKIVLEKNLL